MHVNEIVILTHDGKHDRNRALQVLSFKKSDSPFIKIHNN